MKKYKNMKSTISIKKVMTEHKKLMQNFKLGKLYLKKSQNN
jgi:hypothetical protein